MNILSCLRGQPEQELSYLLKRATNSEPSIYCSSKFGHYLGKNSDTLSRFFVKIWSKSSKNPDTLSRFFVKIWSKSSKNPDALSMEARALTTELSGRVAQWLRLSPSYLSRFFAKITEVGGVPFGDKGKATV